MTDLASSPDRMRDHWSLHPEWHPGHRFCTWHVTFDPQTVVRGYEAMQPMVGAYQGLAAELPGSI